MNIHWYKKVKLVLAASLAATCLGGSNLAWAQADWVTFTMDNDSLVGNDNGYTNGIYVTWFDIPTTDDKKNPEPGFLARSMMWSMPDSAARTADIKTIGQTMVTPDDIEEDPPILPPDDLPYAGLLFYADTFAMVNENYADKVTVTVGIVGEYSFAEEAQEFVHEAIDSDEPCCWDSQLDDEIVFQFSRARFWRTWASASDNFDLLTGADLNVGTLQSSIGASAMIRYGRRMKQSYASALLVHQRTSNPVATQEGWYVFAGARAGYLANQIFLDGNTWDDDAEELDYTEEVVGVTAGIAYSWKDISFTFAVNDLNVNEDDDGAEEYSEYGTITLAWRLN